MTLLDLGNALADVVPACYHYEAHKQTDKYIVWAEDGESGAPGGDNRRTTQILTGTVDYFTMEEFDPNFGKIQSALNRLNIGWRLESIQKESDPKYIHYEWVWQGVFSIGENDV